MTTADEDIAAAEADLGSYERRIQEAERETELAAEFVQQATSKLETCQSSRDEIKHKMDAQLSERHGLQVRPPYTCCSVLRFLTHARRPSNARSESI